MAFADINFSQGSVATYARCCGMFIIHLTANFLRNLPVRKKFVNRLRFDRIMVMSLWPRFLALPVDITVEDLQYLLPDPNALVAVSKGMRAVKTFHQQDPPVLN